MKKRRAKINKFFKTLIIIFVVIAIVSVALAINFNYRVTPIIFALSEAKIKALTLTAVNNAITLIINDGVDYSELVEVIYDGSQNIVALEAKTSKINLLARQISTLSMQNIERLASNGINMPIGAFSGIPLFAGSGPNVKIKVLPVGSVDCGFHSEFLAVGINQTLHKILMSFDAEMSLILPYANQTFNISSDILISECVLVGKVPQTYLNLVNYRDLIDFIP